MYPDLQKELATFERRTPKSAEAHKKNLKRIPLGVASNYRHYDPWPIFVKEASGSKFRDLDGNEYIDHNLTFGALMAGHCHPAVMKAVEKRLSTGTMFGMPHDMEWELAEEICNRFPVEMVRFGNSGTEATMHAIRLARAATGRDKIIKFEGAYHGLHDSALVSVKPHAPDFGDIDNPTSVPGGLGVPKSAIANVLIATFNDLATVERRFKENPGEIAAIILEPILMNVGLCMPRTRLPARSARNRHEERRAADLRRSKNRRETRLGRRQRIFQRSARHDLPRQIDRRRLAAGRVRRQQVGDGSDLATQSFPRRHLQHESGFDGRRPRHVPRSPHARRTMRTSTSSAKNSPTDIARPSRKSACKPTSRKPAPTAR